MSAQYRCYLCLLLCIVHLPARAAYTYETCSNIDSKQLHERIRTVIVDRIKTEQPSADKVNVFVTQQWRALNFEASIAAETTRAVQAIKNNSGYWKKFTSSWGSSSATEFARVIADDVFNSAEFKNKVTQLTTAYLKETQGDLDNALKKSGEDSIKCLQSFAEKQYGKALSINLEHRFTQNSQVFIAPVLEKNNFGGITQHGAGSMGIVAGLMGKQIAQKITQRVVGEIATRLFSGVVTKFIPIVGWATLAYDVVNSAINGALPEIANALNAPETHQIIIEGLSQSLREEAMDDAVITDIAERIFSAWQKFKDSYQQVITLADISEPFKKLLNDVQLNDIEKFSQMTTALLRVFGQDETLKLAAASDIRKLMLLPETAIELLTTSKSLDSVFRWYELADSQAARFNKLVELEIFKYKQPQDLNKQQLSQLLLLNDKKIVRGIVSLKPREFDAMLLLPQEQLEILSRQFDQNEWETLASYVRQLSGDAPARTHFVELMIKHNYALPKFQTDSAMQQVMSAQDKIFAMDSLAGLHPAWWEKLDLSAIFNVPAWVNWIVWGFIGFVLFFWVVKPLIGFVKLLSRFFKARKKTIPEVTNHVTTARD